MRYWLSSLLGLMTPRLLNQKDFQTLHELAASSTVRSSECERQHGRQPKPSQPHQKACGRLANFDEQEAHIRRHKSMTANLLSPRPRH
jgi:hypothetical protein